jgi:hypothetical protein
MAEGVIFAEFTIAAIDRQQMAGWHSHEHISERLEAGVASAARYVSFEDELHFCCAYRASSAEVFVAPSYLALATNASPLAKQIAAGVKGTRCVGDVVAEVGNGQGGTFTRLRLADWSEVEASAFATHVNVTDQLCRMTILRPRRDAPNISDFNWILLIEGAGTPTGLERAAAAIAIDIGSAQERVDVFRLEHAMGTRTE